MPVSAPELNRLNRAEQSQICKVVERRVKETSEEQELCASGWPIILRSHLLAHGTLMSSKSKAHDCHSLLKVMMMMMLITPASLRL
jgi:predicted SAM-dependent methyltransferase